VKYTICKNEINAHETSNTILHCGKKNKDFLAQIFNKIINFFSEFNEIFKPSFIHITLIQNLQA